MPAGVRVWDESGNIVLSLDSRIPKLIGIIDASSAGSISVPEFSMGTPFTMPLSKSTGSNIFSSGGGGSISGNTLSWLTGDNFYYGIY